jgi:hypothetical protein
MSSYIIRSSKFPEMVTVEQQIWVALGHPLTLLLVGAGLTGALIPWFTKRWENRKKELEIKVDIASKMAEAMGTITGEAFYMTWIKRDTHSTDDQNTHYEKMKKWHVDSEITISKLESYFPEEHIKERWEEYWAALVMYYVCSSVYFLKDAKEHAGLQYGLEEIRRYFSDNKQMMDRLTTTYDDDLWTDVANLLGFRGDEIIKELLKLRIKAF